MVTSSDREEIVVDKYVFTGWRVYRDHLVSMVIRKVDFSTFEKDEINEVEIILNQMDLWETFLILIKSIHAELFGERIDEELVKKVYWKNKYDIEQYNETRITNDKHIGYQIRYSVLEANRRTLGGSDHFPLGMDAIKEKLKNVNKWLSLLKIKRRLL